VVTLKQRGTRRLFDGRTASNVGTVATSTARMTIAIDGINRDTMKKARTRLADASA
jgi:hypothetical protein